MILNYHKFKIALAQAGIPAVRLARDIGISRDRISYFANGHAEPDLETAARIAERLGRKMEELFDDIAVTQST